MTDAAPQAEQKRLAVLVVEDEAELRDLYRRVLGAAGYTVLLAPNGRLACRLLEHERVDAVLTDLLMPEMDGIELITWMRREGYRLPVLMVSGANSVYHTDYLSVCRDLGATATLEKPATSDMLLGTLGRLLRDAPPSRLPSAA